MLTACHVQHFLILVKCVNQRVSTGSRLVCGRYYRMYDRTDLMYGLNLRLLQIQGGMSVTRWLASPSVV